jgi:hypothetical protein
VNSGLGVDEAAIAPSVARTLSHSFRSSLTTITDRGTVAGYRSARPLIGRSGNPLAAERRALLWRAAALAFSCLCFVTARGPARLVLPRSRTWRGPLDSQKTSRRVCNTCRSRDREQVRVSALEGKPAPQRLPAAAGRFTGPEVWRLSSWNSPGRRRGGGHREASSEHVRHPDRSGDRGRRP